MTQNRFKWKLLNTRKCVGPLLHAIIINNNLMNYLSSLTHNFYRGLNRSLLKLWISWSYIADLFFITLMHFFLKRTRVKEPVNDQLQFSADPLDAW